MKKETFIAVIVSAGLAVSGWTLHQVVDLKVSVASLEAKVAGLADKQQQQQHTIAKNEND
jgi:hypothetical protein